MNRRIRKGFSLFLFYIYNRIISQFVPIKDKAVFLSEATAHLDGNLKKMSEFIADKGIHIEFYMKSDRRKRMSLKELCNIMYAMTTSKYIFLDDFYGLVSAMKVRKNQNLVQLWHGAGAFKKFGFSRLNTGDNVKKVHRGYKKYTHVSVTSESVQWCYAEAFGIDADNIKAYGVPRLDYFFNVETIDKEKNKFFNQFPEMIGKKIVLVVPTYRGKKIEDAAYAFDKLNAEKICSCLGDDYKVIVRWHPALQNNIKLGKVKYNLPDGVTDLSDYDSINRLLLVTDVLITDYSSVIFDYFFVKKPIIYFPYDLDAYDASRGLYYPFEDYVYGDIAYDTEGIIDSIRKSSLHEDRRNQFYNMFLNGCDGKSTEKIFNWVFENERL
ncbi:MAG: CDP-glycerol glycerophosphotransferase family protein [Peptostreptococcaceae bacterium]|nr:CDP-glycerol glycerophosphotransferase family protein [Peptostreptococcaceae bacterium]MDY5739691.1 CDP-glycerol glycerophosphotransferase family protein [Anaerovoracaceae bacterium]